MKNLAIFSIILFSASISQAQISHDSDKEVYIKDKLTKSESEDVVLFIPMLGNITVQNANYNFKKALMPFQIGDFKSTGTDSKLVIREDSILSIEANDGALLSAKIEVRKE
jgi:hypothetical protein